MRRLYYLIDDIPATENVVRSLRERGMAEGSYHVLACDDDGMVRRHLHAATIWQRYDLVHWGERGLMVGLLIGTVFALWLALAKPLGVGLSWLAFGFVIALITAFGTWVGGMVGISHENYKIESFHDELQAGRCLLLIDVTDVPSAAGLRAWMAATWPGATFELEETGVVEPFERHVPYASGHH